jgi:hypothetical protein
MEMDRPNGCRTNVGQKEFPHIHANGLPLPSPPHFPHQKQPKKQLEEALKAEQ